MTKGLMTEYVQNAFIEKTMNGFLTKRVFTEEQAGEDFDKWLDRKLKKAWRKGYKAGLKGVNND